MEPINNANKHIMLCITPCSLLKKGVSGWWNRKGRQMVELCPTNIGLGSWLLVSASGRIYASLRLGSWLLPPNFFGVIAGE
jgi:hypothetical protein